MSRHVADFPPPGWKFHDFALISGNGRRNAVNGPKSPMKMAHD